MTTTLTVTTTSRTLSASAPASIPFFAFSLLPLGLLLASRARRSRRSPPAGWLALFAVVLLAASIVACGGGDTQPRDTCPPICPINPLGTPAGTYTIMVTGTSGTTSHTQAITLVVN